MECLRTDPINRALIADFLEALFPGVPSDVGSRIGGESSILRVWKFEVTVSFTTSPTSISDSAGQAIVTMTYKPDDKRLNVSGIPVSQKKVTCAGELLDALEGCRQYLLGIVAAIDIALTKPDPGPKNSLGLFDEKE